MSQKQSKKRGGFSKKALNEVIKRMKELKEEGKRGEEYKKVFLSTEVKYDIARRLNDTFYMLYKLASPEGMSRKEIRESKDLDFVFKIWKQVFEFYANKKTK